MGIADDVNDSAAELKSAVLLFLRTWATMWVLVFTAALGVVGPAAASYLTMLGIPAFALSVCWIRHRASAAVAPDEDEAWRYGEYDDRRHRDHYEASRYPADRHHGRYDDPYAGGSRGGALPASRAPSRYPGAADDRYGSTAPRAAATSRYGGAARADPYGSRAPATTSSRTGAFGRDEPPARKPWQSPRAAASSYDEVPIGGGRAGTRAPAASPYPTRSGPAGYGSSTAARRGNAWDSPPPRRATGMTRDHSPVPYGGAATTTASKYGSGSTSEVRMRNNRQTVSNALKFVAFPDPVDRRQLTEVIQIMDREENELMYAERVDPHAPCPPAHFLMSMQDDGQTLRGLYRHTGESGTSGNQLVRVWGLGAARLSFEQIVAHRGSRLFKYSQASRSLSDLPLGDFDPADAFCMPQSPASSRVGPGGGRTATTTTTTTTSTRQPLGAYNSNTYSAKTNTGAYGGSTYASAYDDRPTGRGTGIGGPAGRSAHASALDRRAQQQVQQTAARSERQLAEVGGRDVAVKSGRGGCALEFTF